MDLTPDSRVAYTLATPTPTVSTPGTRSASWAGQEAELRSEGLAFMHISNTSAQFLASHTQFCFYPDPPPQAPLAYAPGCPGSPDAPSVQVIAPGVGASTGGAFTAIADIPAQTYGQGYNFTGAALVDELRLHPNFLSYD